MTTTTINITSETLPMFMDASTRETEKAFCFTLGCSHLRRNKDFDKEIWIPKSLVKDNQIPAWFLAKKIEELRARIGAYEFFFPSSIFGGRKIGYTGAGFHEFVTN